MDLNIDLLWQSDLEEVISIVPGLDSLSGKKVLVTGSTGLICSAVMDLLIRWNMTHQNKIILMPAGRNLSAIGERFSECVGEEWFQPIYFDALEYHDDAEIYSSEYLSNGCDYIIHGAGNASPDLILKQPAETLMMSLIGTWRLLELIRRKETARLLLISSSEVYGNTSVDSSHKIDEYGGIDVLNPRNSYAIGKCAAENLCVSYKREWGCDVVMARPGHIYGPTAKQSDGRVSSMWPYLAVRGEDIVMKSDGSQIRSYCYAADCAAAILTILTSGSSGAVYNISNPQSVLSIRELAEIIVENTDSKLVMSIPDESERKGFNPMRNSSLDASELLELGWRGLFDAERGMVHTLRILKNMFG